MDRGILHVSIAKPFKLGTSGAGRVLPVALAKLILRIFGSKTIEHFLSQGDAGEVQKQHETASHHFPTSNLFLHHPAPLLAVEQYQFIKPMAPLLLQLWIRLAHFWQPVARVGFPRGLAGQPWNVSGCYGQHNNGENDCGAEYLTCNGCFMMPLCYLMFLVSSPDTCILLSLVP